VGAELQAIPERVGLNGASTRAIIIHQDPSRPKNNHQEPRDPFWNISNHQDALIPTMSHTGILAIVFQQNPSRLKYSIHEPMNQTRPADTHHGPQELLWSIISHQGPLIPTGSHMNLYNSTGPFKIRWYILWATGAIVIHQSLLRPIDSHHEQLEPLWSDQDPSRSIEPVMNHRYHCDPSGTNKTQ
jgi:hypothetical protein